jgi:hypothetical protein
LTARLSMDRIGGSFGPVRLTLATKHDRAVSHPAVIACHIGHEERGGRADLSALNAAAWGIYRRTARADLQERAWQDRAYSRRECPQITFLAGITATTLPVSWAGILVSPDKSSFRSSALQSSSLCNIACSQTSTAHWQQSAQLQVQEAEPAGGMGRPGAKAWN